MGWGGGGAEGLRLATRRLSVGCAVHETQSPAACVKAVPSLVQPALATLDDVAVVVEGLRECRSALLGRGDRCRLIACLEDDARVLRTLATLGIAC